MARTAISHVCQQCGGVHAKWVGQCEHCNAWNSLSSERQERPPGPVGRATRKGGAKAIELAPLAANSDSPPPPRMETGIAEFDRVAGGGLVRGSATLIGGDPGIGKSTLLLQLVCRLAKQGVRTTYISGEESADQVRLRASRLGLDGEGVKLGNVTNAGDIASSLGGADSPQVMVIDSIQTMYVSGVTDVLLRATKASNVALLLVGHVTKDGAIAGPRVLEHMVDTVLYFEGDNAHHYRILRGVKNRFGATDEIGVFEMVQSGLDEVANPSELFLPERAEPAPGTVVFCGVEGTRPLLVEIEALVAPSTLASPRRNVVGWEHGRLSMLAAVLEARCGIGLSGRDIFLNVAGGLKISETAADLAVAAALVSSAKGVPVPSGCVFFGEVALSAELRGVAQMEIRLREAAKLGFERAVMPRPRKPIDAPAGLGVEQPVRLADLISFIGGAT